jgi:tRNA(Ile)-lysidine synthase
VSSRRSHPPTLLRLAERTLRDHDLVREGDRVVLACSGGPDSTALLHVMAWLAPRLHFSVIAHGVDHGIRPDASRELELAAEVAASVGVAFSTTRLELPTGGNLQARARTARIDALAKFAESAGASKIATGHSADDRAETMLLRLLRGSGPRGLAVLPPSAPVPGSARLSMIRPLIRARRSDVNAHLTRHRLPSAQDPCNADPRFARTRVRLEVIPQLESMAPRVVEHLNDLADMLAVLVAGADPTLAELGKGQRKTVERARKLGQRGVTLRVSGGKDIEVTFSDAGGVLIQER